jgi:hypothetical protein
MPCKRYVSGGRGRKQLTRRTCLMKARRLDSSSTRPRCENTFSRTSVFRLSICSSLSLNTDSADRDDASPSSSSAPPRDDGCFTRSTICIGCSNPPCISACCIISQSCTLCPAVPILSSSSSRFPRLIAPAAHMSRCHCLCCFLAACWVSKKPGSSHK